jgi:hypothetical protein
MLDMPKIVDLRLKGISFEDALRKMLKTPPPPTSKKSKAKKTAKAQRRAKG